MVLWSAGPVFQVPCLFKRQAPPSPQREAFILLPPSCALALFLSVSLSSRGDFCSGSPPPIPFSSFSLSFSFQNPPNKLYPPSLHGVPIHLSPTVLPCRTCPTDLLSHPLTPTHLGPAETSGQWDQAGLQGTVLPFYLNHFRWFLAKCLPGKHEDIKSGLQHPSERWDGVVHISHPSAERDGHKWTLKLDWQQVSQSISFRSIEKSCLIKLDGKWSRNKIDVDHWHPHVHVHTCMWLYILYIDMHLYHI